MHTSSGGSPHPWAVGALASAPAADSGAVTVDPGQGRAGGGRKPHELGTETMAAAAQTFIAAWDRGLDSGETQAPTGWVGSQAWPGHPTVSFFPTSPQNSLFPPRQLPSRPLICSPAVMDKMAEGQLLWWPLEPRVPLVWPLGTVLLAVLTIQCSCQFPPVPALLLPVLRCSPSPSLLSRG